jgi:hypothetical protein
LGPPAKQAIDFDDCLVELPHSPLNAAAAS